MTTTVNYGISGGGSGGAQWSDATGPALVRPAFAGAQGAMPLLYIGATALATTFDYSAGMKINFNSLPNWVCSISNGALKEPFFYTALGTFPLVGDGSYGSPGAGVATMNAAGSTSVNSWAPSSNHCAAASAVCQEVMAYGERYTNGRKGFVLLNLFSQSMNSGGGGNAADTELAYAEDCINKIVDNGWVPIVVGPYSNTSADSTADAKNSAHIKFAYIIEKLNSLAARNRGFVLVNGHELLCGKLGPYTEFFAVNFTPATPNGIRNLALCQASQNPNLYAGTTSRGLHAASVEVPSDFGVLTLACGIWDAIDASDYSPSFKGYMNPMTFGGDPRYWGTAADASGNPLMQGTAAVGASGSVLSGTTPTGYTFGNQNTNSPTGGLTTAAMVDQHGRSFLRMSLAMTWGAGGSVYSTATTAVTSSAASYTNPPTEGQWVRGFVRLKVHDTCNNITGIQHSIDPYGGQPTAYGTRYANGAQTPWLAPLQGREILLETIPRQWQTLMARQVHTFSIYTPDAALAVSGGVDIFEMGTLSIGEMA